MNALKGTYGTKVWTTIKIVKLKKNQRKCEFMGTKATLKCYLSLFNRQNF